MLYTKIINGNMLGYRNHFPFMSGFAFVTRESQVYFRIFGGDKKHEVVFSSDKIESIAEMRKLINVYYDPRRSGDSAFADGSELMVTDQEMVTDDEDWVVAGQDSREVQSNCKNAFN